MPCACLHEQLVTLQRQHQTWCPQFQAWQHATACRCCQTKRLQQQQQQCSTFKALHPSSSSFALHSTACCSSCCCRVVQQRIRPWARSMTMNTMESSQDVDDPVCCDHAQDDRNVYNSCRQMVLLSWIPQDQVTCAQMLSLQRMMAVLDNKQQWFQVVCGLWTEQLASTDHKQSASSSSLSSAAAAAPAAPAAPATATTTGDSSNACRDHELQDCFVFAQRLPNQSEWKSLQRLIRKTRTRPEATLEERQIQRIGFNLLFQLHFLHKHQLSFHGNLALDRVLVHCDTLECLWLLPMDDLLNGRSLVESDDALVEHQQNDVFAFGLILASLCTLATSQVILNLPLRLVHAEQPEEIDQLIQRELGHVSIACQQILHDCLVDQLSTEDLFHRVWLHHVPGFWNVGFKSMFDARMTRRLFHVDSFLSKLARLLSRPDSRSIHGDNETEEKVESKQRSTSSRFRMGKHRPWRTRRSLFPVSGSLVGIHGPHAVGHKDGEDVSTAGDQAFRSGGFSFALGAKPLIPAPKSRSTSSSTTLHEALTKQTVFTLDPLLPEYISFERDAFSRKVPALYDGFDLDDDQQVHEEESEDEQLNLIQHYDEFALDDTLSEEEMVNHVVIPRSMPSHGNGGSLVDSGGGTFRSVAHDLPQKEDQVHFSAFGPNSISTETIFRVDLWAYLKSQREEMVERALEVADKESGVLSHALNVEYGTLVTICLQPNEFIGVVDEDCKFFRWHHQVEKVSFECFLLQELSSCCDLLCTAKIIVGTHVSMLYIRLNTINQDLSTMNWNLNLPHDIVEAETGQRCLLSTHLETLPCQTNVISSQEVELLKPIGRGFYGDAVLAKWHNEQVVVKTMHCDLFATNANAMEEFRHEAAVMQLLGKHPHVVELFGVLNDDSKSSSASSTLNHASSSSSFALVTEFVQNGSLRDLLHESSNPPVDSFSIFTKTLMARDVAHGLVNIHQGSFIHRDIAARNCLVDENFRIKVGDFGLARRGSQAGMFFDDAHRGFGALKWMAPESIASPHVFSYQSDSFMFGVLLYEIFNGGQEPFPNLTPHEAAARILEGQRVEIPLNIPSCHQKLMNQCFDTQPDKRPTMDQVFESLDKWILQDTQVDLQ